MSVDSLKIKAEFGFCPIGTVEIVFFFASLKGVMCGIIECV